MGPIVTRLAVVVAVVLLATLVGWWWRRREGHLRPVPPTAPGVAPSELAELGFEPDAHGTIALLLSSPTCSSCVTVRRLLDDLAVRRRDFSWTDVDVTQRPEFAERFGVLRLPTTLLLHPDGELLARASGVPAADELRAHLDRDALPVR